MRNGTENLAEDPRRLVAHYIQDAEDFKLYPSVTGRGSVARINSGRESSSKPSF
jgi:hypothetical protein